MYTDSLGENNTTRYLLPRKKSAIVDSNKVQEI